MDTLEQNALDKTFTLTVRLAELTHAALAERGLTTARAELLLVLSRRGSTVQRKLSEALRCTPRHVTGLVDSLEVAGLVERCPHPTDRRATLVALTRAGKRAAARMETERQRSALAMFGELPPEQVRAYVTTVDHMLGLLADPSDGTGSDRR